MVITEPATLVVLEFLMEKLGVTVMGLAPVIDVADTLVCAFFPRVLRSRTALSVLPPRILGQSLAWWPRPEAI